MNFVFFLVFILLISFPYIMLNSPNYSKIKSSSPKDLIPNENQIGIYSIPCFSGNLGYAAKQEDR